MMSSLVLIVLLALLPLHASHPGGLCRDLEYTKGAWIYVPERANMSLADYPCCRDNERKGGCQGEFEWNFEQRNVELVPMTAGNGCSCLHNLYTEINAAKTRNIGKNDSEAEPVPPFQLASNMYEWVPDNCELLTWNATTFCEALGDRTLVMSGDSTMQQTATSLVTSLFVDLKNMNVTERQACLRKIRYKQSDFMVYHPREIRGLPFVRVAQTNGRPDILITQTGPHYNWEEPRGASDDAFQDYLFPKFTRDIQFLKIDSPKTKVVFKTQNHPHAGCEGWTSNGPVNMSFLKQYQSRLDDPLHWGNMYAIDEKVKEIAPSLGVGIIDMGPLHMRMDGHKPSGDCLHYCQPGPLDLFSRILMHKLVTGEL